MIHQEDTKINNISSSDKASGILKTKRVNSSQTKNSSSSDTAYMDKNSSHHVLSRIIQNSIVIWLDSNINESDKDTRNAITQIRRIVNYIKIFTNPDECVDYCTEVKDEKVFLIVSGSLGQHVVPLIFEIAQLVSIYVFCADKFKHEKWARECRKVKDVFTEIETMCNALKRGVRQIESDFTPISIISSSSTTNRNELDQSFMYSQLIKENLLEGEYHDNEKEEFVDFCLQYADNDAKRSVINEFKQNYPQPSPICWYTREPFIYAMLNNALRTQDVEVIIKMSFLVRDIHRQIEQLYSEMDDRRSFTVYRGQAMSHPEFQKMKTNTDGLFSFNNFLSTSTDRAVGYLYAESASENPDQMGIIFQIDIDESISTTPFASLDCNSHFGDQEREILFSMHTVFRIGELKNIKNRLWQINLTLTSENDPQLILLAQHIRKESRGPTGPYRMGALMNAMGKLNKAEEICTKLLNTTSAANRQQLAHLHHQLGMIKDDQGDPTGALFHQQQSLAISLTYLDSNNSQLSATYCNLGGILVQQGYFEGALKNLKHALKIELSAPQPYLPGIATIYNNIGEALRSQGKYDEAIEHYKYALQIDLVHLPPRNALPGYTYNNIGLIYRSKGDNLSALLYYKKSIEIMEKSLLPNHTMVGDLHMNLAEVLYDLHQTQEAIKHARRAADILGHSRGLNHPDVQKCQTFLDRLGRTARPSDDVNR